MIITYHILNSIDLFYYIGFFFHKILTLLGLYVIYRLPLKKKSPSDFILAVYFIIISALFSHGFYYLFHLTALFILGLIIQNYYVIYKKNKLVNTSILILAFGMLALSQILFLISKIGILYATAQIVQLISYITLLILIIRILKTQKT